MTLTSRMTATALRLLTAYGQAITVVSLINDFNPMTGDAVEDDTDSYTGFGYPSNYNRRDIDGELIRADDILLIFSSTTIPKVNDVFTVGAKVMTALAIQVITVSGSDVVYKIQLRQ